MAERRMFSKSIISSARFLRMPQTSRLLYYDLGMAADDDGIVEAFTVIRTTGAAEDDLRVLASKGFVKVLNEDLVAFITDWKRNNYIQSDRYHESIYKEMLVKIEDTELMEAPCIQNVYKMETEVRLGKDRIVKESIESVDKPPRTRFVPPTAEEVSTYCTEKGYSYVNPERFIAFYSSKGWMVGKSKMKNWRSSVSNWELAEREKRRGTDISSSKNYGCSEEESL